MSLEFWDVYLGKSNMHANNNIIIYVHYVLKYHQSLMQLFLSVGLFLIHYVSCRLHSEQRCFTQI